MHTFEFLGEIAILCISAVVVIVVFNRFRLPPVIGLLATGLIVGPSGFAWVSQGEVIDAVSELGIVLLLFSIGLEFSLDDLKRLRSIVLVGGPLQVVISTILLGSGAYFVSTLTGHPLSFTGSVLVGMATALSSTAICIKMLKDRRELSLPHGRAVMGILIFQDIAVVPMMIVVALMSPATDMSSLDILLRLITLVSVTVALFLGLRVLLPRLVPYVTRVSTPEVLILGGLALCLGTAWVTQQAGVSMALGAFIAGMAIGGSEEGHSFARVLQPMRDAFTSMFFLSIGLLVNISWQWLPMNLATAGAILVVNAIVVAFVLTTLRINLRTALMAAVILAQVGEFSFVLATNGFQHGVISSFDMQNMIVSIVITMIVTPTLITIAPWFAERTLPAIRRFGPLQRWYTQKASAQEHAAQSHHAERTVVTIIGGGVLGVNVSRVLHRTNIAHCILELSGSMVTRLREAGVPVVQGDMMDVEALEKAGINNSTVVIVAISDHTAQAQGVALVRKLRPDALVIARTRYANASTALADRGADVVITEEYESSIQVFVTVLEHLGVEPDVIQHHEDVMRDDRYGVLARLRAPTDGK